MPRTFSRGKKIDVTTCFEFIAALSDADDLEFVRQARLLYCPALPLEEQDITDPVFKILEKLNRYTQHLFEFHKSTVVDDFMVHSKLVGLSFEIEEFLTLITTAFQDPGVV